jgi:hypothetical protein
MTSPEPKGSGRMNQFFPTPLYYGGKTLPGLERMYALIQHIIIAIGNLYREFRWVHVSILVSPSLKAKVNGRTWFSRISNSGVNVRAGNAVYGNQTFDVFVVHVGSVTRAAEMFRKKISAIRNWVAEPPTLATARGFCNLKYAFVICESVGHPRTFAYI